MHQRGVEARSWAARTDRGQRRSPSSRGTERWLGRGGRLGAGINCVGVAPDGRRLRFPALGAITGDWGGGYDVGLARSSAAARSEDGQGARRSLERAVPAHFGLRTPLELARGDPRRHDGPPAADRARAGGLRRGDDAVAAGFSNGSRRGGRRACRVAITRLGLDRRAGRGASQRRARARGRWPAPRAIEEGLRDVGDRIVRPIARVSPIVGAALLGLDALGRLRACGAATSARATLPWSLESGSLGADG